MSQKKVNMFLQININLIKFPACFSEGGSSSFPVAVGAKRTAVLAPQPQVGSCILCQEEQEITTENTAMVLTAFVQK